MKKIIYLLCCLSLIITIIQNSEASSSTCELLPAQPIPGLQQYSYDEKEEKLTINIIVSVRHKDGTITQTHVKNKKTDVVNPFDGESVAQAIMKVMNETKFSVCDTKKCRSK
ncbi:MAG: hypothetical protein KHX31_11655 [Akkermansia sp.]|uniref:hypothetical protein n=1 Tax=Akkermansia sp. TaxID=1872421 RepID=UPI0025BB0F10|nr:hypothetical protein [Akkermansia sp.]MBS5509280.1 hypothetical protein [Akkermansia sp.]